MVSGHRVSVKRDGAMMYVESGVFVHIGVYS